MVRRRLTLKRIDPWSVLKFGFVANLAMLAIWLLGGGIVWFFIRQLELIEKVCEVAGDVGFVECGVNGGNLFRALLLLGLLGTVIQTGLVVFLAFLYNLIADLVGGISFTFTEEGATSAPVLPAQAAATRPAPPVQRPAPVAPAPAASTTSSASSATSGSAGATTPADKGAPAFPSYRPAEPASAPPTPASAPPTPANPTVGGQRPTPPTAPSSGAPSAPSAPAVPSAPSAPSAPSPPAAPKPPSPDAGSEPSAEPRRPSNPADWDLFGPRGGGSGGSGS